MAGEQGLSLYTPLITLEEAKMLVECLERGSTEESDQLFLSLVHRNEQSLFQEIGKMTRDLHNELVSFQIDSRLQDIAETEIPDATERLRYIITMTDKAANRTMDAVEMCMPLADELSNSISDIKPLWDSLMHNEIDKQDFVLLCHKLNGLILKSKDDSSTLSSQLTEILMAQDFQDLTGQMINKVIKIVCEVETRLLDLLKAFMQQGYEIKTDEEIKAEAKKAELEGPIVNKEGREDVVQSQDDVDDLLASLGF
ncbi:MAG: protein phosphatase CheZ [Succinivibrionaceae bacterium]